MRLGPTKTIELSLGLKGSDLISLLQTLWNTFQAQKSQQGLHRECS